MSDIGRLQQLTLSELEGMVNATDETTFHQFLDEDPGVKRLKGERERIEKDTLSVANETLSLEDKFNADRSRLIESCGTYSNLREEFETKLEVLNDVLSGANPEEVLKQLRTLSEQKEDQSEEVTDSFLSGECSTKDFLKNFIDKRRDSHVFRVKSEQMSKVVRRDQSVRPRTAGFSPNPPVFPAPYQQNMAAPQW